MVIVSTSMFISNNDHNIFIVIVTVFLSSVQQVHVRNNIFSRALFSKEHYTQVAVHLGSDIECCFMAAT